MMRVYRVWGRRDVNDCVWLLEKSKADAIGMISEMRILSEPLVAALDDEKLGVSKDVVLNAAGEHFAIVRG
jgi:hypothetical protein